MPEICIPAGCVDIVRFFKIDQCTDEPVVGAGNAIVQGGVVAFSPTPQIEEGESNVVRTACGAICARDKQCDDLNGYELEIQICNPHYSLQTLLTGQSGIVDTVSTNTIGVLQDTSVVCSPYVGVEVFERIPREECVQVGLISPFYRRRIWGKVRFSPAPTEEREGTIRTLTWTGMSVPARVAGYGDGPFNDLAPDLSVAFPGVSRFDHAELLDLSVLTAITGLCGAQAIPVVP